MRTKLYAIIDDDIIMMTNIQNTRNSRQLHSREQSWSLSDNSNKSHNVPFDKKGENAAGAKAVGKKST